MIDLRTASRSAARVARHRRAAPASELALVVLYTQATIVGGLFQACPTDSMSHCRFQCYRPLVVENVQAREVCDGPADDAEIRRARGFILRRQQLTRAREVVAGACGSMTLDENPHL